MNTENNQLSIKLRPAHFKDDLSVIPKESDRKIHNLGFLRYKLRPAHFKDDLSVIPKESDRKIHNLGFLRYNNRQFLYFITAISRSEEQRLNSSHANIS